MTGEPSLLDESANVSDTMTNTSGPDVGALAGVGFLYLLIDLVGMVGNALVIYVILSDRKMRSSVTNMFIMNLAIADFFILFFSTPDLVQFICDDGWTLGQAMCKAMRFLMTTSLYASVMNLMALCVERYIAIVHPIRAHILCSKRRILMVIGCIWPMAVLCGLPSIIYLNIRESHTAGHTQRYCRFKFSDNPSVNLKYHVVFKYTESALFYAVPLFVQIGLYSVIGVRLFAGSEKLHRRQTTKMENGVERETVSDAIKARKGVVKMLIACIAVYFLCYSPNQFLILYNTFSKSPFHSTWTFQAFVLALASMNSAANPIMYTIFSQNFRRKFKKVITCESKAQTYTKAVTMDSFGGSRTNATRFTSLKNNAVSEM